MTRGSDVMGFRMTARHWLIGAGAATLLVAGGLAAGPIASLAQDGSDADLSENEAIEIALNEFPDATVLYVEVDDEDGAPVYEIELSNGYELEIDGNSGDILETDQDDDDGRDDDDDRDDGDDLDEPGALDAEDEGLLSEASITVEDAIAAAQAEVDGAVGEVELDREGDTLVFEVEVGSQEVQVDATTGEVLGVENDD